MLDLLDYKHAADQYLEKYPDCEITPGNLYLIVWSLLCGSVMVIRTQTISQEQLTHISQFLQKEKYYERKGKRPTHLNSNFANFCRYFERNDNLESPEQLLGID